MWNGISRTHYSTKQNLHLGHIESPIQNLEYNTVEGVVLNLHGGFNKYLKKIKTNFSFEPNLRYGFNNTHLNAWANMGFRTQGFGYRQKIKTSFMDFHGGKRVSQFNKDNPITPLVNSISTLFYGDNFMKTYENYFGSISYSKRYENGLRFNVNALLRTGFRWTIPQTLLF